MLRDGSCRAFCCKEILDYLQKYGATEKIRRLLLSGFISAAFPKAAYAMKPYRFPLGGISITPHPPGQ
ncbi:hypothetical protein GLE_3465 [Lysobacter enzymogenes]|uniref:Uncharacterized protein n=1 Tax=Lysobacter enzymogenes TaxID=69 RepID=A0A0S2DJT9_LYSEN|nr:hypothetical protein GLE_3465 [Lysobacter enzymogenes]